MTLLVKKWEVQRRLEEIERRLYWAGSVGRIELMDRFGISPQQASADLKTYLEHAGDTVEFSHSTKRYTPTSEFAPCVIAPSIEEYISWVGEVGNSLVLVPIPFRSVSPVVLRGLTQAIHQERSIEIFYRSLSHPEGAFRRISPHSIVLTGSRYHVRAYCHKRNDFRDFVLGRIMRVGELDAQGWGKSDDDEWNTLVIVRIGPHPDLNPPQREVIEADFAMENGETQVKIKQALLLYLLDQFNLDGRETERSEVTQQIILLNPEIIDLVMD